MAGCSRTYLPSFLVFFVLFGFSGAKEILVGGKADAWKVPPSASDSLNKWAERARFQVGDHLGNYVFKIYIYIYIIVTLIIIIVIFDIYKIVESCNFTTYQRHLSLSTNFQIYLYLKISLYMVKFD